MNGKQLFSILDNLRRILCKTFFSESNIFLSVLIVREILNTRHKNNIIKICLKKVEIVKLFKYLSDLYAEVVGTEFVDVET